MPPSIRLNLQLVLHKDRMGCSFFFLALVYLTLLQCGNNGAMGSQPTDGFTSLPLQNSNLVIQTPYNLPKSERYSFIDGIHKLWVFSNDKPHTNASDTKPRSEIRISGYDYSSGVWQFEGFGYVPRGTSGVCIMQIFGATGSVATSLMLRVYDGKLKYYQNQILVPDIYAKWFRLNVIHDVGAGKLQVFIDGDLKLEEKDRGGASHYFKVGVYAQNDESDSMESR